MELKVEVEVYEKFSDLKSKYSMKDSSDNSFLLFLLEHMDSCSLKNKSSDVSFNDEELSRSAENAEPRTRSCPECKYSAGTTLELHTHFEAMHPGSGSFSCTCGNFYSGLPDFLQHYVDCPVAATDLQETAFDVPRKVRKSSILQSSKIDMSGDNLDTTETYHSYHHPSVAPVPGPSKDKPYGCPKCYKGFKSKSLLDQHMHLHYPPRYKCRWCANVYRWPPAYYHHKQKCKKRPTLSNGVSVGPCLSSAAKYSPKSCDEDASTKHFTVAQKALAQFINFQSLAFPQPDGKMNIASSIAPFQSQLPPCQPTCVCSKVFSTLPNYFEHIKSCTHMLTATTALTGLSPGLFPPALGLELPLNHTSDCAEQASPPEDLSLSKESSVYNPPVVAGIFSCSICGKDFTSKLSLKQHVDGKHRAEGKYLCPTCGKRYRWGASFYYHKKTCMNHGVVSAISTPTPELLATHT